MQLFKFIPLCAILLPITILAEAEYVTFKLYGDKVLRVNAALCDPDNYIGKDVVIGQTITEKIPQLKGIKVNVWQMAQLAGMVIHGFGWRSKEVSEIIKNVIPDSLQTAATTVFPFDFVEGAAVSGDPNQSFLSNLNDSKNPLGAVQLYVRSCLTAKKVLAGVEFGYDNVEGHYIRPAGGFLTITDITSSLGIGLSKIAENVIVDKTAEFFGLEERGKRMVRTGIKTVYLGTSMWAKGQLGWFGSIDSVKSDVDKAEQRQVPKSDLARLIEEGQSSNATTSQKPPLPPRSNSESGQQNEPSLFDIDVSQKFDVPEPQSTSMYQQQAEDAASTQLQSTIPVAPPMPPTLSSSKTPTKVVRPKKSPQGYAENSGDNGTNQKEVGTTFFGQNINNNQAFAQAAMREKFEKANNPNDSDEDSWNEES